MSAILLNTYSHYILQKKKKKEPGKYKQWFLDGTSATSNSKPSFHK